MSSTDEAALPGEVLAELAGLSLADTTPESALEKVVRLARAGIPGADHVSITMITNDEPKTMAYSGQLALDLDERQYERGQGPCLASATGGEVLRIDDMRTATGWGNYTAEAAARGALSSLSVPLPEQGAMTGALNVYGTRANAFDDTACEAAVLFASYAAVALSNVHLYDSAVREAQALRRAMESRAVIEQAKGILMSQRRCSAEQAFEVLVRLSQESNVKLRDVASAIVYQSAAQG